MIEELQIALATPGPGNLFPNLIVMNRYTLQSLRVADNRNDMGWSASQGHPPTFQGVKIAFMDDLPNGEFLVARTTWGRPTGSRQIKPDGSRPGEHMPGRINRIIERE